MSTERLRNRNRQGAESGQRTPRKKKAPVLRPGPESEAVTSCLPLETAVDLQRPPTTALEQLSIAGVSYGGTDYVAVRPVERIGHGDAGLELDPLIDRKALGHAEVLRH